jgi:EmrB/QacA subfamily drug resistance transporter
MGVDAFVPAEEARSGRDAADVTRANARQPSSSSCSAQANEQPLQRGQRRLDLRRQVALIVMLTGIFVTVMDNSIVNVAIPSIRGTLGASFAQAELVISGYAFTFAVGLITGGRLGDVFGQRRMFLVGFGAFTLTSALCGLAPWPTVLVVARLMQGMAAALLSPQVFALVRVTFAEGPERPMAFAVMGVVIGMANVIGQILGGVLVQVDLFGLSWRAVFLVNIPIGMASLAVAPFVMTKSKRIVEQRLDLAGVALSTIGLGLLLLPLIEGPELGWPTWSITMLVASPIMLVAFYLHQRWKSIRGMRPLLDTDLFHDRAFSVGALLILIFWATNTPFSFSFTLLAQMGFGQSPMSSALYLASLGASFGVTSLFAGRVARLDVRRALIIGAMADLAGMVLALAVCWLSAPFEPIYLVPSLLIVGVGYGFFMTPILNAVLSSVDDHHVGAASGMLTMMQRGGNALGVAILGVPFFTVLGYAMADGVGHSAAYLRAFACVVGWIIAMLLVIVVLLMLQPPGHDDRATSRQSSRWR